MSRYVIGDIHGHYQTLLNLLQHINYDPQVDQIYLTGDLINGPHSLKVLRWAKAHAKIVLGNHDLHLLAVARGHKTFRKKKDFFQDILEAKDKKSLLKWLRKQPLMRSEDTFVLVHAGIYPKWGLKKALKIAKETSEFLKEDPDYALSIMYGNEPNKWSSTTNEDEEFRFAINAFTRMRVIDGNAKLDFEYKLTYGEIPSNRRAWFDVREPGKRRVFFGHWAALGLFLRPDIAGVDSGRRWGGPLTAVRVEDGAVFQQR